jgi:hypothetical protein
MAGFGQVRYPPTGGRRDSYTGGSELSVVCVPRTR